MSPVLFFCMFCVSEKQAEFYQIFQCLICGRIIILSYSCVLAENPNAPKFKDQIFHDRLARVNDTLKLTCRVKGNPRPYLTWFYEGKPLVKSDR